MAPETIQKPPIVFTNSKSSPLAAAKSLQSCPTLWNPIDSSPPGSPIPGILQARTLEWVAISFSSPWKWKVKVKSLSHVWLSDPKDCSLPVFSCVHGIFPGKSTGVGCHCLLQKAYRYYKISGLREKKGVACWNLDVFSMILIFLVKKVNEQKPKLVMRSEKGFSSHEDSRVQQGKDSFPGYKSAN